ncbi:MAG: hypothetical protein NXI00_23655, partial [Cytophagales bacterium]|nr:hypothetical protein [Cytophagales bacterium]
TKNQTSKAMEALGRKKQQINQSIAILRDNQAAIQAEENALNAINSRVRQVLPHIAHNCKSLGEEVLLSSTYHETVNALRANFHCPDEHPKTSKDPMVAIN